MKPTPPSTKGGRQATLDADLDRFVGRLRARLVAGAATYGDVAFQRPAAELGDEVQQELVDARGWSLIERVEHIVEGGANG